MEIKNFTKSRLYGVYYGMKSRCYNPNTTSYNRYGGRGIKICDEWMGREGSLRFADWALSHGYADDLTIDRIDPNGNYCPENCRWITGSENSRRARCLYEKEEERTQSRRKAAYKYKAGNIKRIPLDMQNSEYVNLKAAADSSGMKVNAYIKAAIREKMSRDAQ